MKTLYEVLEVMRKTPGMYLGGNSIHRLDAFISGYLFARTEMGLEETEDEKDFKEFNNWVQKKLRLNTRKTWCSVILFASSDERDALEKFYKFWDEFLKRNESDSEE